MEDYKFILGSFILITNSIFLESKNNSYNVFSYAPKNGIYLTKKNPVVLQEKIQRVSVPIITHINNPTLWCLAGDMKIQHYYISCLRQLYFCDVDCNNRQCKLPRCAVTVYRGINVHYIFITLTGNASRLCDRAEYYKRNKLSIKVALEVTLPHVPKAWCMHIWFSFTYTHGIKLSAVCILLLKVVTRIVLRNMCSFMPYRLGIRIIPAAPIAWS